MLFEKKILLALSFLACTSSTVLAIESHYLPLKTDPLLELELEKLATVAQMPVLAKPYHIETVKAYLKKVSATHPQLFNRLNGYLNRYQGESNLTQMSIEASYTKFEDDGRKRLANARGRTTDSKIKAHLAGYWQLTNNLNLSLGGTLYDNDKVNGDNFIPHNTYLSYTHDYFQIDLGYKEIWLSPLQESAMLLSTHAKPIARLSISNPKPLTDFSLGYNLSYGKLEKMEGIRLGDERFSGKPGFLSMHFSAKPTDWWTLGASRTMMFGGGPRKITASDVWDAFVDPVGSDNCGGASALQDCSKEIGNQQAAVSSKFDVNWGTPMSIYLELAGEDTNDFSNYKLGNKTYNVGFFFPYLTDKSSLLAEVQYMESGWYVHSIYAAGYRNNGDSMGHWWGDEKALDDNIGAQVVSLRYNHELSNNYHFEVLYRTIYNDPNAGDEGIFDQYTYERAHELNLRLDDVSSKHNIRYDLHLGSDVYGKNFARFAVEYRWE